MTLRLARRDGAADQLRLRPMTEEDLSFAADLHRLLLAHGFFARLGERFLRHYYRTFLTSPHGHAEIALVGDRPAGVLVGTLDHGEHYAWTLRRNGPRLALEGAVGLLTHPAELTLFLRTRVGRYLRGVLRSLRHRQGAAPDGHAHAALPVAVLSHVCVAPDTQGRGVGAALTRSFLAQARAAGAAEAQLVTLAGPRGASGFYVREGWEFRGEHAGGDGQSFRAYAQTL